MAAGKGTRLKSRHPKVLHQIGGKTLLEFVIAAATQVAPAKDVFVIIGHEAERVREAVQHTGVNFVLQKEQRGTGHAIMATREALAGYEHVLVLSGDAPLLQAETIRRVREAHLRDKADMTLLSAILDDPRGYGRVFYKRKGSNEVAKVVEQKSLKPEEIPMKEINSGVYAFATKPLFGNIDRLTTDNAHREFYLTDMAGVLNKAKAKVIAVRAERAEEILGANTRAEMAQLDGFFRLQKCLQIMADGATIYRPETCVIDAEVQVGPDTVIEPFVQLLGKTRIGSDCRIRSYSVINDCEIGDGVLIKPGCIMEQSRVSDGAQLGPYSHLRPGSEIGIEAHVGNFVETKKTVLGKGSKANHLSYLGDATIGAGVNVGAGTITCNYDGVNKNQTVIEDGAFIGSDSTLVAPVKVGRGAYVGAAACVTEDVPEDALAIARARQVNKEGWAKARREQIAAAKGKK